MRVDVVRGDLQAVVPVAQALQGRVDGTHYEVAGIAGQGVRAFAGELEFQLAVVQGFHGQGVVDGQREAEAVVAGTEVGAGSGDPHGQLLTRRERRKFARGGLRRFHS